MVKCETEYICDCICVELEDWSLSVRNSAQFQTQGAVTPECLTTYYVILPSHIILCHRITSDITLPSCQVVALTPSLVP